MQIELIDFQLGVPRGRAVESTAPKSMHWESSTRIVHDNILLNEELGQALIVHFHRSVLNCCPASSEHEQNSKETVLSG
jgi:hypothetical protein